MAPAPPTFFDISLTVENAVPVIAFSNQAITITPNEFSNAAGVIKFNVTDGNGLGDINQATAVVNVTRSPETLAVQESADCVQELNVSALNLIAFNCTIQVQYFDTPASNYVINVTINDSQSATAVNDTGVLTVNSLNAINLTKTSIDFSGALGAADVVSSNDPQEVINTGNTNYTQLNITAFNLENTTNSEVIGSGNVTINISDVAGGQALANNTIVVLAGSALTRGNSSNVSFFFRIDIPSGLTSFHFNNSHRWVVNVTQE